MDWYETIFELIDMRSFSNLWFWIALAVLWSTASHWVIGVPWDMVLRAKRSAGQAEVDLNDMVRINTNRILFIVEESGLWLAAFAAFFLTMLWMLGFLYGNEFAQAVFLLACPMSIVGWFNIWTAGAIRRDDMKGAALHKRMRLHRLLTQLVGMWSIFITALWGMFQNLNTGPW